MTQLVKYLGRNSAKQSPRLPTIFLIRGLRKRHNEIEETKEYREVIAKVQKDLEKSKEDWIVFSLRRWRQPWARGYKTFFMLNSTEHEIFPAHIC